MSNITPKPPEIIQKIEWIRVSGLKYWKHLAAAFLIILGLWFIKDISIFSKNPPLEPTQLQEKPTNNDAKEKQHSNNNLNNLSARSKTNEDALPSKQTHNSSISQNMSNSPGGVQSIGDNVTINTRPTPRILNLVQKAKLVEKLKSKPKGEIEILCPPNDIEACSFGAEIGAALKSIDWKLLGVVQNPFGAFPPGLTILVHTAQDQPPGARALQDALNSINYPTGGNYHKELPGDRTVLLVGPQAE
jgi:hypothetical protein